MRDDNGQQQQDQQSQQEQEAMNKTEGFKKLREPFPPHQIGKLPKPTKQQTDAVKANYRTGTRCNLCGTWHHPAVVHLDYVGHAALTDRLLEVDPEWTWEPMGVDAHGAPLLDKNGGLWIKLTVLGITRIGYGDAEGKPGGKAVKEAIGDALRNAAMRFGCALDLWHKGDLHLDEEEATGEVSGPVSPPTGKMAERVVEELAANLNAAGNVDALHKAFVMAYRAAKAVGDEEVLERLTAIKDARKAFIEGTQAGEQQRAEDAFGVKLTDEEYLPQ